MSVAEAFDRGIPSQPLTPPRPTPASENMGALARIAAIRNNAIQGWSEKAYQDDVIRGRFFGRNSFIVNAPAAIRHVLVENYENYARTPTGIRVLRPMLGDGLLLATGRAWKHQRRTLAPAFTPRAVTTLVPHMLSAIDEMMAELAGQCDGRPVDLRSDMQRMTLEIAGRTMFSFSMNRDGAALRDFVVEYSKRLAHPHFFDLLLPLSWPSPQDIARARFRKRWTAFVRALIADRRASARSEAAPRDLFDLMVLARDPETGEAFSDEQLADQVATMILAGHETTATALFWALYLLALAPETQERVAVEVRSAISAGQPDLDRLVFTRAVLDETMRLYPPAFLIARAAVAGDAVADMTIKPKDIILIAPWLLHRHARLWQDPHVFDPDRFMPGQPAPDRFAYLPFGVGPRVCIGAHFALVEATLALARLIGAYRIELLDREPVIPVGVVTTQPNRSPMFRLSRR